VVRSIRAGALALVLSSSVLAADVGVECRSAKPAGARDYWSWREIEGRRCWYPGRRGLAKDLLRWSRSSVRVAPATTPGEVESTIPPTADFSGTFVDRWNILPPIFFYPERLELWRLP
jgi:hypothetical protein